MAENWEKYATESQSQKQWLGGAGRDQTEARGLSAFFVNDFLCEVEAASALNVAALAGVSGLWRGRSAPSGLADFALRDAVADTDDHGVAYNR